jgi:hypothetical protein
MKVQLGVETNQEVGGLKNELGRWSSKMEERLTVKEVSPGRRVKGLINRT